MTTNEGSVTPDHPGTLPGGEAPARSPVEQTIGADVVARVAEFAALTSRVAGQGVASLDRLFEVTVAVTAELGRTTRSIGEILKLSPGSVVELDRAVSEPVDLMVQGVRLARGEVVVVDDRFAIRIKEIADPKKRS
jgi:flagellar motor switch protein FliN/FliY